MRSVSSTQCCARRSATNAAWSAGACANLSLAGATCLRFAAGAYGSVSKVYAGFSNGVIKLWRSDTDAVTTAATVAGSLAIRGLTLAIEEEKLTIGVAGTATYTYTPAGGLVAGPALNANCNYMIRSGIARGQVVYVASASEEGKLVAGSYYPFRLVGAERIGYGTSGLVAITAINIISTAGQERVLTLWNGSGNNAPPAGWHLFGFNDSAWPLSISQDSSPPSIICGVTVTPVWDANARSGTEQGLIRRTFTLGGGAIASASLCIRYNNRRRDAYLNGVLLTPVSTTVVGNGDLVTYSDVTNLLHVGQTNVLAFWVENLAGTGFGGVSGEYALKINGGV